MSNLKAFAGIDDNMHGDVSIFQCSSVFFVLYVLLLCAYVCAGCFLNILRGGTALFSGVSFTELR